ncbi:(3S,6E)-nerolidol synthase 1-like [Zingiber officinale]|uniref:(3S,6E)-nerolidol synthase 1-like n=1 Tax=Zingiber officinale TaxID=94328 RepID=UPI001C4CAC4D|nr:(3S,6E)-nerolidol synthase 1-like [Zingiber officinale]
MMLAQCSSSFYPKFMASLHTNTTNNPSSTHIAMPPRLHQLQKQRIMKSDIYEDQESLCLRHSDRLSQVRRMFDDQTRGTKETLLFIDSLQKLAIDYHFEEEIQAKMHSFYDQRLTISNGEASSIAEVALLFRLLRQARYPVSTDVLNRFHDGRGEFMASLSKEMDGLMNLFEASNLNTGGELILYRANQFSSRHLRSYMASLEPEAAVAIEHVLETPSHMTLQRFQARKYLDSDNFYHNLHVRELGKMDFTILQSLHQMELKEVTSWWTESDLSQELGFARDQPLKWHAWIMTSLPNPKFSSYRIVLSKIIAFIYLLDDIFDVEGSIGDLHLFVQAIRRWDDVSMNSLPNYMRACFMALNSTINEIAQIVLKEHGWNPIKYLKKSWIELSNAFLMEAKWLSKKQVPTMDDYMKIATITCGVPTVLMHMYFLLGHHAKDDLCEDLPSLISCPARILRLWDDLGSEKDEKQNGRDGSLLACMMKENPHWSLEIAKEKVMQMIDEAWEELNKESFSSSTSTFSQDFVRACLNTARMVRVMYNYEGHNLPMLKEYINLLLFKQI